jgi:phosphate starvation-inducible PhoH-like protein
MTPWLLPIMDSLEENLEKTKVESLINQGKIEIAPIAYMRGRTFKNSFIIADEMQNSTPNQMKMVMTRLGEGSNIVITGDTDQNDRNVENGLLDFVSKIRSEEEYQYIERIILENSDIKRHPAIVEILDIYS